MEKANDNIRATLAVTCLAVCSNAALTVGKLVAGVAMSSAAVLAESFHSGVDLVAALIAFWAVRKARQPADADHAFGHGKYDALSGAAEGLLIFGAAFFIIAEAVRKMITGGEVDHLRTDVWTSLGVLAGIGLIRLTGVHILDPIAAFVVAALILITAWRITKKAIGDLLDRRLPASEEKRIAEIVTGGHPHWLEYHKLRTRRAGGQRHIDLHLVTCRDIPVEEAHRLTEDLEDDIRREFPGAEIITHVEACEKAENECDDACPMYDIKMKVVTRPKRQ